MWTPYSKAENWKHIKIYPPVLGIACAVGLYWLLGRGASETGDFLSWIGVIILVLFTLFLGGVGTWDLVRELRKSRWRAASKEGSDRALVVMVAGKVKYGFGESLRYRSVGDVSWARALKSDVDALDLREGLNEGFRELLRGALANRDLYRDDEEPGPMEETENEALVFVATVLGMAAREEVELVEGRFKGWGRGKARMKNITEGYDLAIKRVASEVEGDLEQRIFEATGKDPTSLSTMTELRDEGTEESREEALDAWDEGLEKNPELIQQLLETRITSRH